MSDVEDNDRPQDSPVAGNDAGSDVGNDAPENDAGNDDAMSDKDSDILSDLDEENFAEYDPATASIEQRPVDIDEDVAKSLKASKRKRADGETSRKPKEGRRQKKRRTGGDDDEVSAADGTIIEGRRRQRGERTGEKKSKGTPEPENEKELTPAERRRRALDKAMDAAIRGPQKKRRTKRDEVDLEAMADEQIADLKVRMERAAEDDNNARDQDKAAVNKIKLLPEVVAMLNRNDIQHAILDPETNFLQAVKFFLEPLGDGSLPAYNIQREIFTALTKLPIEKEALLSSGIGKVVLFYTQSKRPQPEIKRMAERLMGEWSRPILKRTDDYKKRHIDSRVIDFTTLKARGTGQASLAHRPSVPAVFDKFAAAREKELAPINNNPNRAKPVGLPAAYTIAPRSTFDPNRVPGDFRPVGASGIEAFRKMTQKSKKRA